MPPGQGFELGTNARSQLSSPPSHARSIQSRPELIGRQVPMRRVPQAEVVFVELDHGRVVAQGTYEQLMEHSPSFRRMASAI